MSKDSLNPTLSIIIPVYNSHDTLERCISFILNQNYKDFEAIFVDDCSTDESDIILQKYCKLYPNKIIYTKTKRNGGPGYARNIGMNIAKGTYITFIDSDDWIDCNLYSVIINAIITQNADIAIFGVKDEFGNRLSSQIRYEYKYFNCIDNKFAIQSLSRTYANDVYISPMVCQKVYKKSFLDQHALIFKENTYFEDDLFSFQTFLYESKIIIVPNVFYHYFQRQNSITHSFSKKYIDDLIQFLVDLKNLLIQYGYWNEYRLDYYSISKKCIVNTVNLLFCDIPDIGIQKKYIIYLLEELKENFSIKEWVDFLDIKAIKRLFYL